MRASEYLRAAVEHNYGYGGNTEGLHGQIARLALGRPIQPEVFGQSFDFIRSEADCVDFALDALIRILYLYGESPLLPDSLKVEMARVLLDYCHWFYDSDPRLSTIGIKGRCFWTENHQVKYHAAEYLAGQLFPDSVFSRSGRTGAWHRERGRERLLVWMAVRAAYGFNEWLSAGYYNHDFVPLINLVDFAEDEAIAEVAKGLLDLLLLDLALHSFDGGLRSTMGRAYLGMIADGRTAESAGIAHLAFGQDYGKAFVSGGVIALATSREYHVPEAVVAIANDDSEEILIHESIGWTPEEALSAGFEPSDRDDIFHFWSMGAFDDYPSVFQGTIKMCDLWNIRGYEPEKTMRSQKLAELERVGGDLSRLTDNEWKALFRVNVETFKTPDYSLSCAQDYRKGKPGYQQHIWTACLGGRAVVWTNHSGSDEPYGSPNYWVANGSNPRAAQHKNLLIALYDVPAADPRPFSHLYFPAAEFDRAIEKDGWLFGKKGEGYIAVASVPEMKPSRSEKYQRIEWVSAARRSAWVCRMGRRTTDGDFADFVEKVAASELRFDGGRLYLNDRSGLEASFGWDGDLSVNGETIDLSAYPRFDTPYLTAQRGERILKIKAGGKKHRIDLSFLPLKPLGS